MAHQINTKLDTVSIFDPKGLDKGWHGLGTPNAQKVINPLEIAALTGLDRRWERRKLIIEGSPELDSGKYSLVYPADHRPAVIHGAVNPTYTGSQNIDNLSLLVDLALGGKDLGAYLDTGGSLFGGRLAFAAIAGSEWSLRRNEKDRVVPLISAHWSHDGENSLTISLTNIRQVCYNTFLMAMDASYGMGAVWSVKHTKNAASKIEWVREQMEAWREGTVRSKEMADRLDSVPMSGDKLKEFIGAIWQKIRGPIPKDDDTTRSAKERRPYAEKGLTEIKELCDLEFERCGDVSAWNVSNAMTEWLQKKDMGMRVRNDDEAYDRRAFSDMAGDMAEEKMSVFAAALELTA